MPGHQLRPERADKSGGRTFRGPPSFRDSAGPRDVAQEGHRAGAPGEPGRETCSASRSGRPPAAIPPAPRSRPASDAARRTAASPSSKPMPAGGPVNGTSTPAIRLGQGRRRDLRLTRALLSTNERHSAPAMAPMTPPWTGRHDPCCLPSPAIPSPPHPGRRNRHPAAAGPPSRAPARPGLTGEGPHNEQKRHGTARGR
jgi:hypothetical protein